MVGGVVARTSSSRGRSSSARAREPKRVTASVKIVNREFARTDAETLAGSVSFCGREIRGRTRVGGGQVTTSHATAAMLLRLSYLNDVAREGCTTYIRL